MTPASRERSQVWTRLLLLSALAWVLLAVEPNVIRMPAHNSVAMPMPMAMAPVSFTSLALGWTLMLTAMMLPLLIAPVRHLRDRSFTHRRARAIALFLTSYGAIWMAAGVLLLAPTLAVRHIISGSWMPLALVALIAVVWQFSPIKQRCLNRNHAHTELAAFGWPADLDALRFGWKHGVWCFGSCWALMLLPMLISPGHIAVMAAVTLWLFAERLERPAPPQWRWHGPDKALRIVIAQVETRLQRG
jgi:predicted metal-binding membrane protein